MKLVFDFFFDFLNFFKLFFSVCILPLYKLLFLFFLFSQNSFGLAISAITGINALTVQNVILANCSAPNVCGTSTGSATVGAGALTSVVSTGTISSVNINFSGGRATLTNNNAQDNGVSANITFTDTLCSLTNGTSTIRLTPRTGSGNPTSATVFNVRLGTTLGSTVDFYLGGTLNIPAGTTVGTYTRTGNCRLAVQRRNLANTANVGGGTASITNVQMDMSVVIQNGTAPGTITVAQLTPLNFGIIAPDLASSVIVLDRITDTRGVTSGNATIMGTHTLGEFSTSNDNPGSQTFAITATTTNLTGPGTPIPLVVTVQPSIIVPARVGLVPGVNTFKTGGQITINPNQIEGTYTGTYTVTVDF